MNSNLTPSTCSSLSIRNQSQNSVQDCEFQRRISKKLFSEEQSQTILNRIRFLKIKKLFDTIDSAKTGVISKQSVEEFTDARLRKVLKPVFDEILKKDLKLCLGEFENRIDLLLTRIPNNERMLVLGVNTNT